MDFAQPVIRGKQLAVPFQPLDARALIDLAEDLVEPGRATEDAFLSCNDDGSRLLLLIEQSCGKVAVTHILRQGCSGLADNGLLRRQ